MITEEMITLLATTVVDVDIEYKNEISGIKYLESRLDSYDCVMLI